jgi:type IV pilus assembly protein PilA|tara:strand:+ start:932 stop:1450 length:519 start_codon:yes stop_codon:yes gene_type:complete
MMQKQRGFTLIELLIVVAIIGILAAVGTVAYNGYTNAAKKAAVKSNHATIYKMVATKAALCSIGGTVDYINFAGNKSTFSCPVAIDDFVKYMNETVYGLDFVSPYGIPNPSWCKLNVSNCSPPGYMSGCPTNPDMLGYLSIFKSSNNTITVCSNLEYSSGSTVLIENSASFE